MADHSPTREDVLRWWALHPELPSTEVSRHFGGWRSAATLRKWKQRHGLPEVDAEQSGALEPPPPPPAPASAPAPTGTQDQAQAESMRPAAVWVALSSVVPWAANPRDNDAAALRVAESISRFGYGRAFVGWQQHGERRLVVGHTARKATLHLLQERPVYAHHVDSASDGAAPRCRACAAELGARHVEGCAEDRIPEVPRRGLIPIRWRDDWADAEARAYALADNELGTLAGWVPDLLAEQLRELEQHDLGHGLLGWDSSVELSTLLGSLESPQRRSGKPKRGDGGVSLAARFGVPPFSLLDGRRGPWRDRKRQWLALGIRSELGRQHLGDTVCMTPDSYMADRVNSGDAGSVFDPVLVELACRWFAPEGGCVLDPFAGGSVRGVVASALGHAYTGIDLRAEQLEANRVQWERIAAEVSGTTAAPGLTGPLPTSLPALMRGFRVVDEHAPAAWWPYLCAHARTRPWPRHFASPLLLAAHGREYLWGVLRGCLVVVKRRSIFRTRVLYLLLPPMSADGDHDAERAVLEAFRAVGVSAKLQAADVELLGYDMADVMPDTGNVEAVYRAGDWADLAGPRLKRWRNWARRWPRLVDEGRVSLTRWSEGEAPRDVELAALGGLVDAWAQAKGKASTKHMHGMLTRLESWAQHSGHDPRTVLVRDGEGAAAAMLISEPTGPECASLLVGVHDYTNPVLGAAGQLLHLTDMHDHLVSMGPGALLNSGAAGHRGEGLEQHKRSLRPAHMLQLYDLKVPQRFTEEDWGAVNPDALAASPVSALAGQVLPRPTWVHGDSRRMEELLPEGERFDLVLTCPPYFDLEVYSDGDGDVSAMDWPGFVDAYRDILAKAAARLADNRFAVVVIGDVRDAQGAYRGLVRVTEQALEDAGLCIYNHAIYLTHEGTLPIRAGRQFMAGRKLAKMHQDVVIAYKGDPRKVRDHLGEPPQWVAPDTSEES